MRQLSSPQVVSGVPPPSRKARPPRSPKPVGPPGIVETLRKAIEWRRQLDASEVPNQAAIARREGVTRARVTQVLGLLRLPPEIRWRGVLYEGQHDPIVSDVLLGKAREVLDERNEDLKGRQWRNGDERLLTGIIKCTRCESHMFGGGGQKGGRYVPYYVCSKRFNQHECKQDYARAELLESAIVQDIKAMFRDKDFMARVWAEANRRHVAELPAYDSCLPAKKEGIE